MLSKQQIEHFTRFGYLVLPKAVSSERVQQLREVTEAEMMQSKPPLELEADVQYPGAPSSNEAEGGQTIRRLLSAYTRHDVYKEWAESAEITQAIKMLLRSQQLYLSLNHHNCIMTKHPLYSSRTDWHRDTRYWRFNNKYLVNSWLALGDENAENGGMLILPGSHRWDIAADALDKKQFLIEEHPSNIRRLSLAKQVDLNAGDCLLFSAHCFHAAGANHTNTTKLSVVLSYHGEDTQNLVGPEGSQLVA